MVPGKLKNVAKIIIKSNYKSYIGKHKNKYFLVVENWEELNRIQCTLVNYLTNEVGSYLEDWGFSEDYASIYPPIDDTEMLKSCYP